MEHLGTWLTGLQEELKREKSALQREFHKWQSLPDKIGQYFYCMPQDIC